MKKEINEEEKILLVTHADLDGAGCAIIFKKKYPAADIQIAEYDSIDIIASAMQKTNFYNKIYFTDITPSEELGRELLMDKRFFFIDHHKTRNYLKEQKDNPNVIFDDSGLYSGTFLLNQYLDLADEGNFVKLVNAWDCWLLEDKYRKNGEDLNYLFSYYGIEKFIKIFLKNRKIVPKDLIIANTVRMLDFKYLENKLTQIKKLVDSDGNKYAQIFIGEKRSGISNLLAMAKDSSTIDRDTKYLKCININDQVVSLYSSGDFDVSALASLRGGGGHPAASGYHMTKNDIR